MQLNLLTRVGDSVVAASIRTFEELGFSCANGVTPLVTGDGFNRMFPADRPVFVAGDNIPYIQGYVLYTM